MGGEIKYQQDATRLEARYQSRSCPGQIGKMMVTTAYDHEVEVMELGTIEGFRGARLSEEVADHRLRIQTFVHDIVRRSCGSGVRRWLRVEAEVVCFDHILTDIDTDILGSFARQCMCHGTGPAGVVEHSDGLGLSIGVGRGGEVCRLDADPIVVGHNELGHELDHVLLPLFCRVRGSIVTEELSQM